MLGQDFKAWHFSYIFLLLHAFSVQYRDWNIADKNTSKQNLLIYTMSISYAPVSYNLYHIYTMTEKDSTSSPIFHL